MRKVTFGLCVWIVLAAAGPAFAELTWGESISLWWKRSSLTGAREWYDRYTSGETGLNVMFGRLSLAAIGTEVQGELPREYVEEHATVKYDTGLRSVTGGWRFARLEGAAILAAIERGDFGSYVKSDVRPRRLAEMDSVLAADLFNPTGAGKARARKRGASLYHEIADEVGRHRAWCQRNRIELREEIRTLEREIAALEAKRDGRPIAQAPQDNPPTRTPVPPGQFPGTFPGMAEGSVSLLGVGGAAYPGATAARP